MADEKLTKSEQLSNKEVERKLNTVSKALTTGAGIDPSTMEDGSALRYEFLDSEVTTLTWTEGDLEFYRDIPKVSSPSTVAQYNVFTRHGQVGPTRFVSEIGVSTVSDPNIRRKSVPMKFISDTKQISLAAQVTSNTQDPAQLLQDDAIANVAKTIEWASFYGDSALAEQTGGAEAGLQFDGLAKLIAEGNVLNANGEDLSEELLNHAAVMIGKGFGNPTDAYMPIGVQAQFINKYLQRQTQLVQDNSDNVNLGFKVNGFNSARGFIKLHGSTVMELDNILDETLRPMPDAPREPEVTAAVDTGKEVANFKLVEGESKEVSYAVTVNSEQAKSAPGKTEEAVEVIDGAKGVKLEIKVNGMYGAQPQFVSVYRFHEESGQYYLIKTIPMHEEEDGVITFVDLNDQIPGTADVFVGEMSQSVIHLFEFLPMIKWNLARVNATETFSILWYGALALRAPKKWVRIKNVGYQTVANAHSPY